MGIMHSGHFWQLSSIASLPELQKLQVGRFWQHFGPNMASEAISECLILKMLPGGACSQTPLAYSHLSARNGCTCTSLKQLTPALSSYRPLISQYTLFPPSLSFIQLDFRIWYMYIYLVAVQVQSLIETLATDIEYNQPRSQAHPSPRQKLKAEGKPGIY